MRRAVVVALVASGALSSGCIGLPFASLGGRGRVALAGPVGDLRAPSGETPSVAVQAHVGTAILSVTDPGPRDLDVEVGYALDAFPGQQPLDRHGGYAGLHWFAWQEGDARVSIGGDVDVLWGFDQRLAAGATFSVGIEGIAACEGAMGGGDLLYAGLVGWGRGEWGIGAQLQASYRFVEGEHYATFGASISVRFPAGIGAGYVTALAIAEVAGSASGSRGTGGSSGSGGAGASGSRASAPFGFCERVIPTAPVTPEPREDAEPRWLCEARVERERESGVVIGGDQAEAEAHCREEFVLARADGSECVCAPEPALSARGPDSSGR